MRCHHFLESDIREQQKYEKRIQTSVDNTANDLLHEIKFENRVENKNNFLLSKLFLSFLQHFLFIFLPMQILKIHR